MHGDLCMVIGQLGEGIQSFRDLEIWQRGIELVKTIYSISGSFPQAEIYGLTSQMRRAAISIPSNIAEGQIRRHRGEFRQFLHISLGSLAELETQLIISFELGYIKNEILECILADVHVMGKKIRSLIKKLTTNNESPKTT